MVTSQPIQESLSVKNQYLPISEDSINAKSVIHGDYDNYFVDEVTLPHEGFNTYWLKVQVHNSSRHSDWQFVFNNVINRIEFYDGSDIKITGEYVPFKKHDQQVVDNVIHLKIEPSATKEIYIKITPGEEISVPLFTVHPLEQWEAKYLQQRSKTNFETGIYLGLFLLTSFALLIFFSVTHDRAYLYLGLYLLFDAIYILGVEGYFWFIIGGVPQLHWILESIFLTAFYISFYQFLRYYFNLKDTDKLWNNVFIGMNLLLLIFLVVRLLAPHFIVIRSLAVILVAISVIIFFIKYLKDKHPTVMYIFAGSMAFFVALILGIVFYNFGIDFISPTTLVRSAIVIQILLFSTGLALRIRLVIQERQEAHLKYIKLLRRNEQIQKEANETLERKVVERTNEILRQRREIEEKAKQLEEINEEIRLLNENLERDVEARTLKIKNQNAKLIDYAFRNAHHVRGPLARILGLVHLINKEDGTINPQDDFLGMLMESAEELDTEIRKVNKLLEDEEFNTEKSSEPQNR